MIPEAAVEAAARAAYESTMEDGDTPWDHFGGSSYLDYFRAHARAALEAVAPRMLAEAWDEGRAAGWDDCVVEWQASVEQVTPNPYRTAK